MDITIHSSFLPHTDPDASLAFYRDVLGFEVRLDVGYEDMRWITVGPEGQADTAIVLHPPAVGYDVNDEERELLMQLIAKGSYFGVNLATDDLDAAFARVEAAGADIVQEPIEQDYGVRDAAFRDPAGNLIRLQQTKKEDGDE
ncbi:MAG: VOC family protein [Microbacterium sp.]|nr:MAG: VOC family protein [Microbacterium sp.]